MVAFCEEKHTKIVSPGKERSYIREILLNVELLDVGADALVGWQCGGVHNLDTAEVSTVARGHVQV